MPSVFLYLMIMLAVVVVWFAVFKRPVYEAMLVVFLLLLTITGNWSNVGGFITAGMKTSLLYSMTAFVAMSVILTRTKVIDSSIAIIFALLGRVTGGAGYVSVIASSFMGALSGSGPGNVMATGVITIPAMKRSGFPPELAANIESNSSYMGNMIPPSSNIVAALGAYTALYPDSNISTGRFWIVLWGIAFWFILQRALMVYIFCKYYHVKRLDEKDIPSLAQVFHEGWQGLLLPLIILLPFVLDYFFKDSLFTMRLGSTGAKYFSSSMLLFIAGIASFYTCLICKDKSLRHPSVLADALANSVKMIAPPIGVCLFGYMIGALFGKMNVAEEMEAFILSLALSRFGLVLFVCTLTCFLGMVIPGSSLTVIFGPIFITTLSAVGINPLLAAAMLPCICGVMCGITPPLGLGLYAGMSLAGSDFGKTFRNNIWWVAAQFVMEALVLIGALPVFGLV